MKINIQTNRDSSDIMAFSATELTSYLDQITSDHFIINYNNEEADLVILLSSDSDCGSDCDKFSIHIGEHYGTIQGSNDRSVLLGVYHYLYLLGCRFLAPGKQHEALPYIKKDEELYADCEKKASFHHRGICIEGSNSIENILDTIDWLPKLGYNSFFLQFKLPFTFLARWYRHEMNPLQKPEPFTLEDAARLTGSVEEAMKKRGLILHQAGHGWTGETIGCSSVDWKPTHTPLSEQNSEKLAMLNGKRQLFKGIPMNTNLCYSNPDVKQAFTKQITDFLKTHENVDYLHVWLADEPNNFCECESCRKSTPSDQYIELLNQIDKELTAIGSDAKIVFLLYQELLWPPIKEKIQNPDRFLLMFAPISRTFNHSYEFGADTLPVPEYVRNNITLPTSLDENLAFLRAWQDVFKGDSFVYDYPLGRAHYGDFGYVHIAKIISEDIRQLHRMGMNGYLSCQELRVSLPNALPNYVMGRMLFEESLNFDDITEEYYRAAYGAEWESVLSYLSEVSRLCDCDYFNGKGPRKNTIISENMQKMITLIEKRQTTAKTRSSAENIFWKYLDYQQEYGLGLGKALLHLSEDNKEAAQEYWRTFQHMICEKEPEFQSCLDVYRITEVSSKYTGFILEEYLKKTL